MGSWVACAAAAGMIVLGSGSADAKDEFEHAFKYEAGRIAANVAAGAGLAVLGGLVYGPGYHPPHPVYAPYPPPPAYGYGYYGAPAGYYYYPPPHYQEHHHDHHGRGCNGHGGHGYRGRGNHYQRGGYGHGRHGRHGWDD